LHDPTGKFVSKDEEEWLKYAPEEKKKVGTWLGEKTGITDIKQGYASLGKNSDYGQERAKLKEMEKSGGNMKERQ
jgi:hypothetical protein